MISRLSKITLAVLWLSTSLIAEELPNTVTSMIEYKTPEYDNREPDNGQPKQILPGQGAYVYCGGINGGNCSQDILDSYGVYNNRVQENLQRLKKRWSGILSDYKEVKQKHTPLTEFTIEQDLMLTENLTEIYKNSYEVDKYNRLLEKEMEMKKILSNMAILNNELDVMGIKK